MAYTDYDFDPTGADAANKITNEIQPINMANTVVIVPDQGAFFEQGLKVEARTSGSDPWVELTPYDEYVFSPLFVSASAKTTRKLVFSYILLNETKGTYSDVRLNYQCIGKYQDDATLTLLAGQTFDRSKVNEWVAFGGTVDTFSSITRDTALKDKSLLEIMVGQLALMREAIVNPNSSGKNMAQEVARLEQKISSALLKTDYDAIVKENEYQEAVTSGAINELLVTDTDVDLHKGLLYFRASTGEVHSQEVTVVKTGTGLNLVVNDTYNADGSFVTVTAVRSSDNMVIRASSSAAGNLTYKTISDIRG